MKRRKHNSPHKRGQRFFGRSRLWAWESDLDADGTRLAYAEGYFGAGWVQIPPDVVRALVARPQNWIVCCRALCRHPGGEEWIESEIASVESLKLNELEPIYADMREGVLAAVHPTHIIDMGWIAQTWRERANRERDEAAEAALKRKPWYMAHVGQAAELRRSAWLEAASQDQDKLCRAAP